MIEERRDHVRIPVIHNVGEPIELRAILNGKKILIPGYIINLSAGGIGIIALGRQSMQLHVGAPFVMDLNLPSLESRNVKGKIVRIQKGRKAQLHHSDDEWFLSLAFTKIKPSYASRINRMAEDWSICETKVQMRLPDICFRKCSYWNLCEKPVKLKEKEKKDEG
jgi:hypothetical protein